MTDGEGTTSSDRDGSGAFLTAEWRDLVLLNYEVDPAILRARVPAGCELDAWDGIHLASVVGFRFLDTRLRGLPIPFHRHFEEVNLRFYVRRRAEEGWRRGVVFVREIVPRRLVALVARRVYGEPYVALPMRHAIRSSGEPAATTVAYQWRRRGAWEGLSATFAGPPETLSDAPPEGREEGSVDEDTFVTEHYWGYTRRADGSTTEYRVEHPRWRLWRARRWSLEAEVATLYGPELGEALSSAPRSVLVAEGSPVVVRRGRRLE